MIKKNINGKFKYVSSEVNNRRLGKHGQEYSAIVTNFLRVSYNFLDCNVYKAFTFVILLNRNEKKGHIPSKSIRERNMNWTFSLTSSKFVSLQPLAITYILYSIYILVEPWKLMCIFPSAERDWPARHHGSGVLRWLWQSQRQDVCQEEGKVFARNFERMPNC